MRRYGNLWDKITSEENIRIAYNKARKGKGCFKSVINFDEKLEENLNKIRDSLINKTYKTPKYQQKTIYEPKERIIYVLPFTSRVIQHAIMNILEPIFEGLLIKDTYACIKNRGIHTGSKRTMEFVKKNEYCYKGDIRKFYPSMLHSVMVKIIEQKIKDKNVLWILKDIIYSFEGERNLPIGNLTSQWFGNLYMNELDKFVKEKLKIKCYLRYCDDFCLFSNNKEELRQAKEKITVYLKEELGLDLSKSSLFKTNQGVDFLGYRHFRGYILVRKRTAKRVKKKLPKVLRKYQSGKLSIDKFRSIVASTVGWLQWANTYNLRLKVEIEKLQGIIANDT